MATTSLTKEQFAKRVAVMGHSLADFKFIGNKPAVIDFYAHWCGPCNMVAPILDDMSKEYDEKVDFYKVNVDEENELSAYFGIRSIPTILFINGKGDIMRTTGAMSRDKLREAVMRLL